MLRGEPIIYVLCLQGFAVPALMIWEELAVVLAALALSVIPGEQIEQIANSRDTRGGFRS
jgi:hypothetical protein